MNRYEDRLLELDLREVLNLEAPPDVWPLLAPRLAPQRPRLRHLRGRRRPPRPALRFLPWAAAAVVLLALGVFWWAGQPSRDPGTTTVEQPPLPPTPPAPPVPPVPPVEVPVPLGRADRGLLVAGPDGTVREDREFFAGERVVIPAGGAVIRLAREAILRLADAAWLRFDGDGPMTQVELARGSLVGESGEGELALRVGIRDFAVEAGSRFACEPLAAPPEEHESAWLGGFTQPAATDLLVSVSSGRVSAEGAAAGSDESLICLAGIQPRSAPTLAAEPRAFLDRRLAAIDRYAGLARSDPAALDASKEALQGGRDIEQRLLVEPQAWGYVVPWLERRVLDLDEERAGRIALRILVLDPELRALATVHLRLEDLGTDARPIEVLPLAERVEDPVAIDIMRRQLSERIDRFDVFLAAFFAFRGDETGREILDLVLADPERWTQNPTAYFAAAAGLHRLGQPGPWGALRLRLEAAVETALEEDRLAAARRVVGVASYFAPVVRDEKAVFVADASRRIQGYTSALGLDTAEDVRRELAGLP